MNHGKELVLFFGEINSNYSQSDWLNPRKRTSWILPHIVYDALITGAYTFHTDANKSGKADYKSDELSKVEQSPYNSVQKVKLFAILMVIRDFIESLNILTNSKYAERVILHIETSEFIPANRELTSLFIQVQDMIRNRLCPMYITHIRSHTGLPGPLAQDNAEIDQLFIGNLLQASEINFKKSCQ